MLSKNERVYLFDNLKCLLILLVVIGHFVAEYMQESNGFKSIWVFIYLFHMPFFIFISGYFHTNKNILCKICYYFSLGFLLKCLFFSLDSFLGNHPAFYLLSEKSLPWFMFALGAFIGLTFFLRNFDCRFIFILSLILGCYIGYDKSLGKDFLLLPRICVFYPFYIAGTIARQYDLIRQLLFNRSLTKKICSYGILCFWGITCFFFLEYVLQVWGLFSGRNAFASSFYYYGALVRLMYYFFVGIIIISFVYVIPNRKILLITSVGESTLSIYFWHVMFLKVFIFFNILFLCTTNLGKVIYILLSILLTIFLSHKIFSFPCNNIKQICFKGK